MGTVGGEEDGANGLGALDDSGRYPGAFGLRGELHTIQHRHAAIFMFLGCIRYFNHCFGSFALLCGYVWMYRVDPGPASTYILSRLGVGGPTRSGAFGACSMLRRRPLVCVFFVLVESRWARWASCLLSTDCYAPVCFKPS